MDGKTNPPVSNRERDLLLDIPRFNRSDFTRGWQLKQRSLGVSNLGGIRLSEAAFEDVDLTGVGLAHCRIENSTFKAVCFAAAELSQAIMKNVSFVDCTFAWRPSPEARFTECTFQDCRTAAGRIETPTLTGCTFDRLSGAGTTFGRATIQDCRIRNSDLRNISFPHCRIENLEIADSTLDSVRFPLVEAGGVVITGGSLDNCSFSQAELKSLRLRACSIRSLTMPGARVGSLEIEDALLIKRLSAMKSSFDRMVLQNCRQAAGLFLSDTKVTDLSILESRLHFLRADQCLLGGLWQDSIVHGVNLNGSRCTNLFIRNVVMEDFLNLNTAHFEGLQLMNVRYEPGIRISQENVRYDGQARLDPAQGRSKPGRGE